ncbi:MAG: HNH endonuclease signature motif containing protein [Jatrophihabitantaceae bacterium]
MSEIRGAAQLDEQPAELDRYGPVPAVMGRRIATDPTATVHTWRVDAAGRLLDQPCPDDTRATAASPTPTPTSTSTAGYQPTARITRHVLLRDPHCVHPGCRRAATHCELDHREPWPAGATSVHNLQPLCRRHHDLKHHSRWDVTKQRDGSYDWRSPTGHTYRYRPPELPTPESDPQPLDDEPPPF